MIDYPALLAVVILGAIGLWIYRAGRKDGRQDGYDVGFAVGSKALLESRSRQPLLLPATTTVNHYHIEAPKPARGSDGKFTKPGQSL